MVFSLFLIYDFDIVDIVLNVDIQNVEVLKKNIEDVIG